MSLGLTLNVIVGFFVVDGRWRGREAILDLDFTISHRCKCQFCQKRFRLRVLALRRVCKQMTIVAMRPCCKTGAKVVLRRSTTLSYFLNTSICQMISWKFKSQNAIMIVAKMLSFWETQQQSPICKNILVYRNWKMMNDLRGCC